MEEEKKEEKEPKTLFEHMGVKGPGMEKIKKLVISFMVFIAIGYILGTIVDISMGTNILATILALALALIWILKVFGKKIKVW